MDELKAYRIRKNKTKRRDFGKKLGLTNSEMHVLDVTYAALCLVNPNLTSDNFDSTQSTKDIFNNDRTLFETYFCMLVEKLDVSPVMTQEDIPENNEFEKFPTFLDIANFFYAKYILRKNMQ